MGTTVILELTKLFPSKWIFTGFGIFTLCIAVLLSFGIKDVVIIKKEAGSEALLRSTVQTGTTPQGEHRSDNKNGSVQKLSYM